MLDPETVQALSISIAAMGFLVALAGLWRSSKRDEGSDRAQIAEVLTEVRFISNDLKDLKADYRSFRNEIKEVRAIAEHASERAEAAHDCLDRTGIDKRSGT